MILLDVVDELEDEEDASSSKPTAKTTTVDPQVTTQRRPESFVDGDTDSVRRLVLPDYATSQALAEQAGNRSQHEKRTVAKKSWWKRRRRFWRAVLVAFLLYVVITLCIAIPLLLKLRRSSRTVAGYVQQWVKSRMSNEPTQDPLDMITLPSTSGEIVSCSNWTSTSYGSTSAYSLSYNFPANETLTIVSNFTDINDVKLSQKISGRFSLNISNNVGQTDGVVSVSAFGGNPSSVNACLMRTANGWGLTLFVPGNITAGGDVDFETLQFDVTVQLPPPPPEGLPSLKGITTSLPAFNQTFGNLDPYGLFDSFSVIGSLGAVEIDSVNAKTILVENPAGNITGTFNTTNSLILDTVLAPINANVSLHSAGDADGLPTFFAAQSGSSDISVNVTTYDDTPFSPYGSSYPPFFLAEIQTFGGIINANFFNHNASRPSTLYVKAQSNLEPAQVYADAGFQGTYDVRTTLSNAIVDRSYDVMDPAGLSRIRSFQDDIVTPTRLCGWTGWGPRPSNDDANNRQGHIEVVSSLSPAILQLTQVPDPSRLSSFLQNPPIVS